jgi:hypothetical protein
MLNLSLIILQLVFPLCDYKVWFDTERGEEAKITSVVWWNLT